MKKAFRSLLSPLVGESRAVLRGLVRRPGYALAAWVMLGLAVAANTAVFAIVYGFMLKPLPYAQPARLSVVRERLPKLELYSSLVSVKHYLYLKKNLNGIENAGLATWPDGAPVDIGGRSRLLGYEKVTPSLLRTLGVTPVLGRLPAPDAGRPGGPAETVISYRLWQSAYGGRHNVLGKQLKLNSESYRIVGVLPRNFFFEMGNMDVWIPYVMTPARAEDSNINYWMVVRRKPGVSLQQLNLELRNQRERLLAQSTPAQRALAERDDYTLDAGSLRDVALAQVQVGPLPWLLQAAAGLLLLLALANTVNLGLVRQRGRQQEFALRRVLGANYGELARIILAEHIPIALAVGLVATLLAWSGITTLHAFGLPPTFSPFQVYLAPAVVAFCWLLTLVVTFAVALGPAVLASGRRLIDALGRSTTTTGGRTARSLQRTLGIVQVALACALVIGSALLGVSLWRLLTQPVSFAPGHRIVATLILPARMRQPEAWKSLASRLRKLPDVSSVAATDMLPFSKVGSDHSTVNVSGNGGKTQPVGVNAPAVSARFFSTMDIRLVAGRGFTPDEIAKLAPVTVINAWLARHYFGSVNAAIGKSLGRGRPLRIVGVSRDVAWQPTHDQYENGTMYLPFGSNSSELLIAVVQARGPLVPTMSAVRRSIEQVLPSSAIFTLTTLPKLMRGASVFRAAGAGMVGTFAALALLIAALGVFAITAFIARSRLGEYGIRAALGAGPGALLRLGFGEAAWLLCIGLPIGLGGAYLLGRVIASALYRTPILDPGLYVAGAVIIAAVVMAAAWGPARRAARAPIRDLIGGGTQ